LIKLINAPEDLFPGGKQVDQFKQVLAFHWVQAFSTRAIITDGAGMHMQKRGQILFGNTGSVH
jgi:hypothetical protein